MYIRAQRSALNIGTSISLILAIASVLPSDAHTLLRGNLPATLDGDDFALLGTSWTATSIAYPDFLGGGTKPPLDDYPITLSFSEDNRVTGYAGCNQFTGDATSITSSILQLSDTMQTAMWCGVDGVLEQEEAFGNAVFWHPMLTYEISSDEEGEQSLQLYETHIITSKDGTVSERGDLLARFLLLEEPSLVQSKWEARGVPNSLWGTDAPLTLFFESETEISGYAGCNGFNGEWEEITRDDGPRMFRTKRLITTRRLCDDDIMKQERSFMGALRQDAVAYSISHDWGGELTLYATSAGEGDSNDGPHSSLHVGQPLVRFRRIASTSPDDGGTNKNFDTPGGLCVNDSDCHTKIRSQAPRNPTGVDLCQCYAASTDFPFDESEGKRNVRQARCVAGACEGYEAYCPLAPNDNGMATCALRPIGNQNAYLDS